MSQLSNESQESRKRDRLLLTLERLLKMEALEVKATLNEMAQLVAEVLEAEKVDVFLYDASIDTLVALGTSNTPLGKRQHALGLNRLPLTNGGYIVRVFLTGGTYLTGHLEQEPDRISGMVSAEGLGLRSEMAVALDVNGERRGVLMASSRTPDFFSEQDLSFLEAVAGWVGTVIHKTELSERLREEAVQHNRRMLAEELLTMVAHSLRGYLTPLRIHVDLMQMRAQQQKRGEDLHDAVAVKSVLYRLGRLISDLLDVARLDQGFFALNEQPVDLTQLVRETAHAFETPEMQIVVEAPQDVMVVGDAERLSQALENLLTNAVAHAFKKTAVLVKLAIERHEEEQVAVLTVSNQGPAIPSELLPRLFQPFVKGQHSRGLGLGLYLARRIAVAHRGTLDLRSADGDSVRFALVLPLIVTYTTEREREEELAVSLSDPGDKDEKDISCGR
jgi:two-component system OmpR family sensor kinase